MVLGWWVGARMVGVLVCAQAFATPAPPRPFMLTPHPPPPFTFTLFHGIGHPFIRECAVIGLH